MGTTKNSAKLPLRDEVLDLALVLRTDDPLDNEPEVQRRWLALMRKYPGKNALAMAADFLDALAPPSTVQSKDAALGERIPIKAAKHIAHEYGYDQVVIFARNWRNQNREHVTTYGKTVEDCDVAARMGNHLKRVVGWPEEKCNDVPRRMKQAQDDAPKQSNP